MGEGISAVVSGPHRGHRSGLHGSLKAGLPLPERQGIQRSHPSGSISTVPVSVADTLAVPHCEGTALGADMQELVSPLEGFGPPADALE